MKRMGSILLFYGIVMPVSILPFPLLYAFSGLLRVVGYHVVGYRREVIQNNLRKALPELSEAEVKQITKAFYGHFADLMCESAKMFQISKNEVMRRAVLNDASMIKSALDSGRSVMVLCGHYSNWEYYALSLKESLGYPVKAVYQPLADPVFNDKMQTCRERFGTELIPVNEVSRLFREDQGSPFVLILLNDQCPSNPKWYHWNTFLSQDTVWNIGPELLARRYDMPVFFAHSKRESRGFYSVDFESLSAHPAALEGRGALIDLYAGALERVIRKEPRYWLWSHRRWKRKREPQPQQVEAIPS